MACVVGVAGEDGGGTVNLLSQDEARDGVCEGERAEREKQVGSLAGRGRPSAGGADRKDDVLRSAIALRAQPGGKAFRGELTPATVEQDGDCRRASGTAARWVREPFEECFFRAEGLSLCRGQDGAAGEELGGKGFKRVAGAGTTADMGQGELHGEENSAKASRAGENQAQ